jgi:hypothetical protein
MSSFIRRYSGPLFLFLGGAALIAVAPFVIRDRSDTAPPSTPPPDYSRFYGAAQTMPGVRRPPVVSAAASGLTETDDVIGVVVRGKARAYSVQVMAGRPQNHVINDLIAGTPVTVTFNNRGRIVRVFAGTGSEPLDVKVGMSPGGDMILAVGGEQFIQRSATPVDAATSGQFPLESVDHELTTWKKWHDAHPDTDAVVSVTPPKS